MADRSPTRDCALFAGRREALAGRAAFGVRAAVVAWAAFLVWVILGAWTGGPALAASSPGKGLVYAADDRLMLDGKPFLMKGYNYYPRDYGWTAMADWDWDQVDTELALAAQYGANTIRTGIDYEYLTGDPYGAHFFTKYKVLPENLETLEKLLSIADAHGLKVVFWLGPAWGAGWDPENYRVVEKNLESIIPRFAGDPRLAAWDLATDLDGSILQPPPLGAYGVDPHSNRKDMVTLLENMARTARRLDPDHLLAVGFCWPTSSLLVQEFTDFLMPQFLGGDVPDVLTSEGPAVFEDYASWFDYTVDPETAVDRLAAKIQELKDGLRRPMPIVLAEYGSPCKGEGFSESVQAAVYQAVLETAFLRTEIAGALNWALTDFNWPPKGPTFAFPDGFTPEEQSFGIFDVDYRPKPSAGVAAAYYADRPEIFLQTGSDELGFVFEKSLIPAEVEPGSDDERELSVAFDWIEFRDQEGKVLLRLDVGTAEARTSLRKGFFQDESSWDTATDNFVWAGGAGCDARVEVDFPEGTHTVAFRVFTDLDQKMDVLVDGDVVKTISLHAGPWRVVTVGLDTTVTSTVGDGYRLHGSLSLPISKGTVVLEVSTDGATWKEAASVTPTRGRFAGTIEPAQAGTLFVRPKWSGGGLYGPAVGGPVEITVAAGTATTGASWSSSSTGTAGVSSTVRKRQRGLGGRGRRCTAGLLRSPRR